MNFDEVIEEVKRAVGLIEKGRMANRRERKNDEYNYIADAADRLEKAVKLIDKHCESHRFRS